LLAFHLFYHERCAKVSAIARNGKKNSFAAGNQRFFRSFPHVAARTGTVC
jgi:hypothetical protein